MHWKRSS